VENNNEEKNNEKELAQEIAEAKPGDEGYLEKLPEYMEFLDTKIDGIKLCDAARELFQQDEHAKAINLIRNTVQRLVSPGEVNIAGEVREFVDDAVGWFKIDDVYRYLGFRLTRADKKNVSNTLGRLVKEEVIIRNSKMNSLFRKIDTDLEELGWREANSSGLDIHFPLQLHKYSYVYPKNVFVFAGTPDAGKTALFLNFAWINQEFQVINYYYSEGAKEEFRKRVQLFGYPEDDWKMNVYSRSANFADVIKPNEVNIIDYIELGDEVFKLGRFLREIYDALDQGIAIIGIQKKYGTEFGYGQELGLQIPRFYMNMEFHKQHQISTAQIQKCKNRKTDYSMIGKMMYYKLFDSCKFEEQGEWHYRYEDDYDKIVFPRRKDKSFS